MFYIQRPLMKNVENLGWLTDCSYCPGETRWDKESHVGEGLTKLHPTLHNLQVHEPSGLTHNWTEWSLRSTVIQVSYPLRMGWGQACAPRILCISSWVILQCTLLWVRHALCLFIIYLYMFMLFPLKLRTTGLAGKHSTNKPTIYHKLKHYLCTEVRQ